MTRRARGPFFAWIGLLLLAAASAQAAPAPFKLLTPFPGAVVHSPEILLVFTVLPTTKVLVQIDGKATTARDTITPGNEEDLHHLRIPLDEGRHTLRVLNADTESELGTLSLTYIPSSSLRTAASKGDQLYLFHTREHESLCNACHSLPEAFETFADRPMAPAGKVCGACHPAIEASQYLHGPVAVYECFKCHGSEYKPSRFSQKTSQGASCSACHQDFLTRVLGGSKFVHGPVAAGVCIVCHDPHGSKNKALTVQGAPPLCLGCHASTLPLPVDKGLHAKLACTKCHDSHGAAQGHLLATSGNRFCAECHPKPGSQEGHPIAGHPTEGPVDPSKPGQPLSCQSCHDPHGLKDISKASIMTNETIQRQFCRRCHY